MKPNRLVRVVSMEGRPPTVVNSPDLETLSHHRLAAPLRAAIHRTRQWLLGTQHADGYWVGELEGDTILESEYVLLLAYLGQHESDQAKKAARYIQQEQLPGGGWAIYPGGQIDISASVKAYFALKLTGHNPSDEHMQRARAAILAYGGADAVNSFTRFYLALLGQISYVHCPAVPPEVLLLPKWLPINVNRISAWSRTILVPLSIMSAHRPVANIDPRLGIAELFLKHPDQWPPLRAPGKKGRSGLISWESFFRTVDRSLKFAQRHNLLPLRRRAIKAAEKWMVERFAGSEGLGAIFPPMIWSIVALRCLGYRSDSAELRYCHEHLDGLIIEEDGAIRLQPCKSPVWDTAITLRALDASGVDREDEAVQRATDWLLNQEVRRAGDWSVNVKTEPAGWCFEHANEFYPDVDDTIMVMMALHAQCEKSRAQTGGSSSETFPPEFRIVDQTVTADATAVKDWILRLDDVASAVQRAGKWVLAMQNRDGGWGAFDRDNDHEFLCHVPFADHNAMIDPSTPDLTARVLECLAQLGHRVGDPAVDRAIKYMRDSQEADGSWFGRWGVNYVYGTWQALVGLCGAGVPSTDPMAVAAVNWLLAYQQPNGGWGESPDSYADPTLRGQGQTTASQTAWALLGLMAAGQRRHPAVARGIRYLIDRQNADGTWSEPEFTGTGFPQVFYLRYHMYPIYFPLLALSRWAGEIGACFEEANSARILLAETASGRL